ncbi:hypothetical protein BV898_14325 [Hypsibius exemplaris]|uniref:Uncharacterized protein n=1 Tax=Hypsibius exemplaris TaxID=2072580 RepID=A0A9X6RJE4_HYPEX|nr:hypothetical protein BV898_14325 [Hypsibius exemplaris]
MRLHKEKLQHCFTTAGVKFGSDDTLPWHVTSPLRLRALLAKPEPSNDYIPHSAISKCFSDYIPAAVSESCLDMEDRNEKPNAHPKSCTKANDANGKDGVSLNGCQLEEVNAITDLGVSPDPPTLLK